MYCIREEIKARLKEYAGGFVDEWTILVCRNKLAVLLVTLPRILINKKDSTVEVTSNALLYSVLHTSSMIQYTFYLLPVFTFTVKQKQMVGCTSRKTATQQTYQK